jgi:hypothetical protein
VSTSESMLIGSTLKGLILVVMRPIIKTKTSPAFRTLEIRWLSGLDVTKPTNRVPSWDYKNLSSMRVNVGRI